MTKKYIVKNCPAYMPEGCLECACITPGPYENFDDIEYQEKCQDWTYCLIKQVVEKCKKYNSDLALTGYQQGKEDFADEILQLFIIEEVE